MALEVHQRGGRGALPLSGTTTPPFNPAPQATLKLEKPKDPDNV